MKQFVFSIATMAIALIATNEASAATCRLSKQQIIQGIQGAVGVCQGFAPNDPGYGYPGYPGQFYLGIDPGFVMCIARYPQFENCGYVYNLPSLDWSNGATYNDLLENYWKQSLNKK